MKEYPSIEATVTHRTVYVFAKIDGSNIRAEWSKKRGFYKFGSRNHLIDASDLQLGEAVTIFNSTLAEPLSAVFKRNGYQKALAFAEFFGPGSSHGNHVQEPHKLQLFDLALDNRGIVLPRDFTALCADVPGALDTFLAHEKWNEEKSRAVHNGAYPGQSFEGVVCKANEFVSPGLPLMFKVKSAAWLKRLRELGKSEEN